MNLLDRLRSLRPARLDRAGVGAALLGLASLLPGCDYVAEKNLVPGQHSEQDVRQIMGVPTMVWDLPDGAKQLDYARAPQGFDTFRVEIGSNGKYLGMKQLLTPEHFKQARPNMTGDELTRMFSKPTEVQRYALKKETIWMWKYVGDGGFKYNFNAHFEDGATQASRYSVTDDKSMYQGG
jgi:hypothetical protein